MESFEHRLPARRQQDELLGARRSAERRSGGRRNPRPAPPSRRRSTSGWSSRAFRPDKDVDGFHPVNAGRLAIGLHGFVPCTPLGCLILLRQELGDLTGLDAIVVGRSNIVGKPMAQLLLRRKLHGDRRAFPNARPARGRAALRHRRRRGRPAGAHPRRLDQAGGNRHRRRAGAGRAARRQRASFSATWPSTKPSKSPVQSPPCPAASAR